MSKPKSAKRALGAIVLSFESIVVFFATLAAFGLQVADGVLVWAVGLTVSILLILTPAVLGKPGGYALGWVLQLVILAAGLLYIERLWGLLVIGIILFGFWAWALIAGGTIDRARANLRKLEEEK